MKEILRRRRITANEETLNYLIEEYDQEKSSFVKYIELEKDYKDIVREMGLISS